MNLPQHNSISKLENRVAPRSGFSLLELAIVLIILVATAAIIMPMIRTGVTLADGQTKSVNQIATETTLRTVRDAIVSECGVLQGLSHEPDALPRNISELVSEEAPDHVKRKAPELTRFDPLFGVGWHGPYLMPTGTNEQGEPTIVDGWGKEIELQIDFNADGQVDQEESRHMRLVSAGPNGEFETPVDTLNMQPGDDDQQELTRLDCGDDMVVFVTITDNRQ